MAFRVKFRTKPVDELCGFGENGDVLHYFAATDSHYHYELDDVSLLIYKNGCENDYYLKRFTDDFFPMLPVIGRCVPKWLYDCACNGNIGSLYDKVTDKLTECVDNDASEEIIEQTENLHYYLFGSRLLEHGFLRDGLDIYFYRYGDMLLIRWQCRGSWAAASGQRQVLWSEFISDIRCFADEYFAAMACQTESLARSCPPHKIISGDIREGFLREKSMIMSFLGNDSYPMGDGFSWAEKLCGDERKVYDWLA